MDLLAQIMIAIFGVSAIAFVGLKDKRISRWGYLFGLLSQPFWFYTLIYHEQWGIVILGIFYTLSWANGLKNNWKVVK